MFDFDALEEAFLAAEARFQLNKAQLPADEPSQQFKQPESPELPASAVLDQPEESKACEHEAAPSSALKKFPVAIQISTSDKFPTGAWAIAGDLFWDGASDFPSAGMCVVVHESLILVVCTCKEASDRGLAVEMHPGCCLMPGLIDAHVHMEFSEHYPLHEQLPRTHSQLQADMEERALRMLQRGITAARDLGGSAKFAAVELRDRILAGHVLGPRLVCAGQPITVPGGHCHQWGGAVSTLAGMEKVARRQVNRGADWLKIMATGGMTTAGSDPQQVQFSQNEINSLVRVADGFGKPVAAHAHGTAGVLAAVLAGCRTIEHCSWLGWGWRWGCVDNRAVREMTRRDVYVSPTAHANWVWRPMGESNFRNMSAALTQLHRAGVRLITSSDAGAIRGLSHDALPDGVLVLADMAKMSPVSALRAATSQCAEAIGLGKECGRLAPGFNGDLILVPGDPTKDLTALKWPRAVISRGKRVVVPEPPPAPRGQDWHSWNAPGVRRRRW